jgi:double-strand break repair protein MRE11
VEVAPLLLQKGKTKLALYGLGSMREERLNRLWNKGMVQFLRTDDDDVEEEADDNAHEEDDEDDDAEEDSKKEKDKFFHMFVLHQNRDVGRGTKNCVQEAMIPGWMDAVLWVRVKLINVFAICSDVEITHPMPPSFSCATTGP